MGENMDDALFRGADAYHEAGHAVIAYEMGWWVNHEGVEIEERQYCGLRRYLEDNTIEKDACVTLAGWCAEHKWHGRGQIGDEQALLSMMDAIRGGYGDDYPGDMCDTLTRLISEDPDADDAEVLARYAAYQQQVKDLLAEPRIW